jgi:hypothetical protein
MRLFCKAKEWEPLKYLDWKLEFDALIEKEELESLKLAKNYKSHSVERLNLPDAQQLNLSI